MKNSKWIAVLTGLTIMIACFLPWTYHADIGKTFTGFFSEQNMYGRPGIFFIYFSATILLLLFVNKIWAKRVNIFLAAIMVSYAIKTFILYSSCYNAYCPERKPGLYLMLIASIIMLVVTVLPEDGKQVSPQKNNAA